MEDIFNTSSYICNLHTYCQVWRHPKSTKQFFAVSAKLTHVPLPWLSTAHRDWETFVGDGFRGNAQKEKAAVGPALPWAAGRHGHRSGREALGQLDLGPRTFLFQAQVGDGASRYHCLGTSVRSRAFVQAAPSHVFVLCLITGGVNVSLVIFSLNVF